MLAIKYASFPSKTDVLITFHVTGLYVQLKPTKFNNQNHYFLAVRLFHM